VRDYQLPEFVGALPANQIFNSASHASRNGRKHAGEEPAESPSTSELCLDSIRSLLGFCAARRPPKQHILLTPRSTFAP